MTEAEFEKQQKTILRLQKRMKNSIETALLYFGLTIICLIGICVNFLTILALFGFIFFGFGAIISFSAYFSEEKELTMAQNDLEAYEQMLSLRRAKYQACLELNDALLAKEKEAAEASQRSNSPWAARYFTEPCPNCGHYKVRYSKWEDKQYSVAFWGVASDKLSKDFKCEHCGKMW